MIVLDTNVASELVAPRSAPAVLSWADRCRWEEIHLTAVTVAELLYGVALLQDGSRRRLLMERIDRLIVGLDDRMVPFDAAAAPHYADIAARRRRRGRPIQVADAQIAAICRSRGAVLATRNVRDFEGTGVTVVDPWTDGDR